MTYLLVKSYHVRVKVTKNITFTYYPGFLFRNAMLGAMAELYCEKVKRGSSKPIGCGECRWREGCLYEQLNLPVEDQKESKPQAYLFDVAGLKTNIIYPEGTLLAFEFRLFGWASDYLLDWINAILYMGERSGIGDGSGRFMLVSIAPIEYGIEKQGEANIRKLKIALERLHFYKTPTKDFVEMKFDTFVKRIQNRIERLASTYGDPIEMERNIIGESAIKTIARYVETIKLPYPPHGNMPYYQCYNLYFVFEGNFKPYETIMQLGSLTGIGQLTVAGLGLYSLEYE